MGILSIPISEDWESREFLAHCVPVWTRQRFNFWLIFDLQLANFCAFPIDYPTVPKGQSRTRLIFHAANTKAEVDVLASTICSLAQENRHRRRGFEGRPKMPKAAQQIYALMADVQEEVNGCATD